MEQDVEEASSSEEVTLRDHCIILRPLGKGSTLRIELNIITVLGHKNIFKLSHIVRTKEHIYMVKEHAAGGYLVSHTEKVGCLQEEQAHHIFTQMAYAVNYCQENSVAHRDIKAGSILMDGKGNGTV
ncbi:sperm motility kinase X-like [Sigmodon hispidus]